MLPVSYGTSFVENYVSTQDENRRLKRLVASLVFERERLLQYRDERVRMRRLAAFKEEQSYSLVPAEVIGTDAAERWVGFDEFKAAMERQFAATESLEVRLDDEAFKIHHSGEVAWYSGVAGFKGTSAGEDFEFDGLRVTAVLEKRDAGWLIVQYHGSAPVTGQLVEY